MAKKQRKKKNSAKGKKNVSAKTQKVIIGKEHNNNENQTIVQRNTPKISMVSIVKNEEAVLERCIQSLIPIIDEFIIVDTGSTDGTKSIIEKYGKVYEDQYTSEVETKQRAISLATGDYVVLMDADEWIVNNVSKLRQYAEAKVVGVSTRIHDVTYDATVVTNKYYRNRMFKNDANVSSYAGPKAHGYVKQVTPPIVDRSIIVYHTHDHKAGDQSKKESKVDRTLGPLKEAVKINPDDSRAWFYLARTYMMSPICQYQNAIETFQHYLGMPSATFAEERWWAIYDIARCYSYLQEYDKCLVACDRAIEENHKRAEGYNLKGQIYYMQQQWGLAAFHFKEAMEQQEPDGQLFVDPREYYEVPADYLATCMYKLGSVWEAYNLTRELIGRKAFVDQRLVDNLKIYEEECKMKVK